MQGTRVAFLLLCLFFAVVISQSQTLPTCTSDDLSGDYTRCLSLESTRTLYYYYVPGCNVTGAPIIPPPKENLPCNIDCDPGEYLPLDSTECELCEPGTYSLGGGSRFHKWQDKFPKTTSVVFKSYCSHSDSVNPSDDYPGCGWTLDGYETSSGDLTGLDSVNSILEVSFVLLEEGSVGFYFMCDIETDGDTFAYKLDTEAPVGLPRSAEYIFYNIPNISAGTHKIRWIFYKNPQAGTGQDIARITDVQIYGISAADDKNCSPCPPGYFQPESGQDTCLKCSANTYSALEGSETCMPCEGGYSYEGATSCTPYENSCTVADDAVAHYTECELSQNTWSRTKYWTWEVPLFCNSEGVELPDPEPNQPCAPCPPGSFNSQANECIFCNNGHYSSDGNCVACRPGTVAIPAVYYTEWDELPRGFSTFCYGSCSGDGWQLYHDSIRAVISPGVENDLLLTATVDVGYGGSFDYAWRIHGSMHESYFKVTVDGKVVSRVNSGHGTESFPLSYGMHVLGFWAHGDGVDSSRVDISTMTIFGIEDGGAAECTPCPPGYYQADPSNQFCTPCSYGRFNPDEGATSCEKCEEDTYASRYGQTECVPCPDGAHSARGAGYCQNPDCTYISSNGDFVYNLSPYAGIPQFVENEEPQAGHYLVSYCGFLYENDSGCTDSYICETFDTFNPYAPGRDYLNWAHAIDFEENSDPKTGFSLKYNGGEAIGCDEGRNRTATVKFHCEADVSLYTALEYSSSQSSECDAVFEQSSIYGCPVCTFDDFEREEGDCKDGEMVVQYKKKKHSNCNGVVKDAVESCGDVTLGFGLAVVIVVVVLVVLLLLFVAIGWFVLKHRRLKIKYTQLRAANVEMTEVEDGEETE